jgi:hypothetical protein
MTNGRDGGGISREEAARDGGWATTVLRMECGGMVGADATAWGYTDVHTGRLDGCRAGGAPAPAATSRSLTVLTLEKTLMFDLRRCGRSGILYVDTGPLLHFRTGTGCVAYERR